MGPSWVDMNLWMAVRPLCEEVSYTVMAPRELPAATCARVVGGRWDDCVEACNIGKRGRDRYVARAE